MIECCLVLIKMDDVLDDFMPLSITCKSSKSYRNGISLSQVSSVSRLSQSYIRSKKKHGCQSESTIINNPCTSSTVRSMVSMADVNQYKDSHHQSSAYGMQFCPVCQAPFDIMKIDPHVHAHQCNVIFNELAECPEGELCFNDNPFHYRDYAHRVLAQIRASKGHLAHEALRNTTPEKVNKLGYKSKHLSSPRTPLKSNKKVKRPSTNIVRGHSSAHQKKLFSDEQTQTLRKDGFTNVQLQNDDEKNTNTQIHKCNLNQSAENAVRSGGTVNHITEDLQTFTRDKRKDEIQLSRTGIILGGEQDTFQNEIIKKDLKVTDEDLKSAVEGGKSEESKVNVLTALDHSCKKSKDNFEEQTGTEAYNCECNRTLKLDAVVEYTVDKLDKRCGGDRNVRTCVLPCKVESDSGQLNEVRATMSVVLSPSKENSVHVEDKLKTPVKVDASCSEVGWQTVGIAALPDTEVGDVTVSLCKCNKTMQINCSLLEKHTVTNCSDKRVTKNRKLESKFFSNVKELELPHKSCEKDIPEVPNHHMSVTSYFQSACQSSHTLKFPAGDTTKDVTSSSSSFTVQDSCCFKPNDLTTRGKECLEGSSKAQEQTAGKESVVGQWKQLLDGMRQKGLSTMSVMSDDSLAVTSGGHTSASNSHSSYQYSGKKTCPSYKRIPETSFVVDAFQYGIIPGISHYFLSHFHSDHYGGLRKSFSKPVCCSRITAALVKMKLHVNERYLHVLELDIPKDINGVLVTALDANHCPGSVMFLFQLQNGQNFLHVGDFRADPKMESYPCFWNVTIDKLYLDTTYCEPRYNFPMQSETIAKVVELAEEHHSKAPETLFVCGTYTLGKEKVFLGIVEALNCKLWVHPDKRQVLECIDNKIINERLTGRQWEAQVHVCRMSDLNISFLKRYLKQHQGIFTHIVAFSPTGWEMRWKNKNTDNVNTTSYGNITIYGIPYSEHSSFTELKRFVQFLKPGEIIPTVNVKHHKKQNAMEKYFRQWLSEPPVTSLKRKNDRDQYVQQKISQYFKDQRMDTDEDL